VDGTAAGCFFKHDILYHISIILEDFLEQLINSTHSSKDLHLGVSNVKIKLPQPCRTSILLLVTTSQFFQRRTFLHIFTRFFFRCAIEPFEFRIVARPLDAPSSVYVSLNQVYFCSKSDCYSKIFTLHAVD
jgi:hypothetical protein